jgi:hypothetical protein
MTVPITSLTLVTSGFPTQWEAQAEDGRFAFVHFRHGVLSVAMATASIAAYPDWSAGENIWEDEDVGTPTAGILPDECDGIMSCQEMQRRTADVLDWRLCKEQAVYEDEQSKRRVLERRHT